MCLRYSSSVGGADRAQLAAGEHRLEQVGRVDRALGGAGAHDRVQLVDERMMVPPASEISLRTAFSRSSNSPRYFEPAISPPMSSAITRRSRRESGMSPATMRWARPSTIAVLPTPGSPIRTGLFFVRRERTWIDPADLIVAPDHRVQLALLGKFGEVAPELLERLVLVLRVLVGHAVRPAHVLDSAQQRLVVGAGGAQRLAGGCLGLGQREQQVLGGDVLVLELARLLLGGAQNLHELGGGRRRGRIVS